MNYNSEYQKLVQSIIDEHSKCEEYQVRTVGKCILFNNQGIALTANRVHSFNLLPGGGIDEGEDLYTGIQRECLEETGFEISIKQTLMSVSDYRNRECKKYDTTCVVAETSSYVGTELTKDEIDIGFEIIWINKERALEILKKQVELVKENKVEFYNTKFNIIRDYLFLKTYLTSK